MSTLTASYPCLENTVVNSADYPCPIGEECEHPGGGGQAAEHPDQGAPPLTLPHTPPQREV